MPSRDATQPAFSPALASPLARLLAVLVPSRCAGGGDERRDAGGGGFCAPCWEPLARLAPEAACPVCALPGGGAPCRNCEASPPPVERPVELRPYGGTL
ncbi:MAG TPA: hypothetical protein PK598_13075, partial [Thermoanaerobaculia bacterium]|nr:hypothetical protein [Thermoanaerobaculia bacterium]